MTAERNNSSCFVLLLEQKQEKTLVTVTTWENEHKNRKKGKFILKNPD